MSNTPTTSGLSTEPPPLETEAPSFGSDQLAPGTRLEPRSVFVRPGEGLPISPSDIVSGTAVEYNTPNVSGGRTLAGVAPTADTPLARFGYTGTKLVDRNGTIARDQYDPSREAYSFLAQMDSGERLSFLNALQSRGLIGKGDVTARFTSRNIGATSEFLMYANHRGVTGDVALGLFLADPNIPTAGGGGGRVRTTPKEDLRAVFRETTRKYLGREVSAAEIEKFVNSYTNREIAEARGGAPAPSATTAAEVMVQERFGEEAQAMRAVNFANIIEQKIKGLA